MIRWSNLPVVLRLWNLGNFVQFTFHCPNSLSCVNVHGVSVCKWTNICEQACTCVYFSHKPRQLEVLWDVNHLDEGHDICRDSQACRAACNIHHVDIRSNHDISAVHSYSHSLSQPHVAGVNMRIFQHTDADQTEGACSEDLMLLFSIICSHDNIIHIDCTQSAILCFVILLSSWKCLQF